MIQLSARATKLAVTGILIVSCAAIGTTAYGNEAAKPSGCSTIGALTDWSTLKVTESLPPDLNPGDTIGDVDNVVDAAGRPVGTGYGATLVYTNPKNGEVYEAWAEWADIDGGVFYGFVTLSVVNVAFGEPIEMPITGVSGRYKGQTGTLQVRLYWRKRSDLSDFASQVTSCG